MEPNDIFDLFQELVNSNPQLFSNEKDEGQMLICNRNLRYSTEQSVPTPKKGGR